MFQLMRKIFALFGYRLSRKKPRRNFASSSRYEGSSDNLIKELLDNLYNGQSPYSAVDIRYRDEDYPHTNITTELLETLFVHVHEPRFILEFGSMLGGSAMIMAQSVKRHGYDANIVCVDPFTGDANMWGWEAVRNDVLTFSREITIDESALENALNLLPGSEIVDGKILLFQKQWVLFSPGLAA